MGEHLRLGSIAGVRIGVNASVLVIVVLLVVGVSAGQLPLAVPGRSPVAYAIGGTLAAAAFFASLLAHELSHALVARRHGIEVEGITLWMLGGVATLRGEAATPQAELAIAGVGPLVSLLLGGAFGLLALLVSVVVGPGLVLAVLLWLALINVILAVFNLAPAAPLDGGRILRAILWRRHGDPIRAAVTASGAGRVFGYLLVAVGVVQVLAAPGLAGLWWVLIGFFIVNAATAEGQAAQVRGGLSGLSVADVMSPDPVTVPGHLSLDEVIDGCVLPNRFASFPVVDGDGRPVGLLTLQHVRSVPRERWGVTSVARVATPMAEVVTASPAQPVVEVIPRLSDASGGRVLVIVDGRVIGIVSPTDLARALERAALRRPPDPSPPWQPPSPGTRIGP